MWYQRLKLWSRTTNSGASDSEHLLSQIHPTGWQTSHTSDQDPKWLVQRPTGFRRRGWLARLSHKGNLLFQGHKGRSRFKLLCFILCFMCVTLFFPLYWLGTGSQKCFVHFWLAQTRHLGLALEHVYIPGNLHTLSSDILAQLDVEKGQAMLTMNLPHLAQKLEKMPWIKSVQIERQFPGQLNILILERLPVAIWQQQGIHHVVDIDGVYLPVTNFKMYAHLPLIIGQEALEKLPEIMAILRRQPDLQQRVRVITRQGRRRWSLTFENDIIIHLPEIKPNFAWDKLNSLQKVNNILDKDIKIIDLRLPDKIILQRRN